MAAHQNASRHDAVPISPKVLNGTSGKPADRSLGADLFEANRQGDHHRTAAGTAAHQRAGLIHGGLIAALTDNAMGYSCGHEMGGASSLVTIGLAIDFIGSAQIGQWLAVESDVIKTGSTICFAQCLVKADGAVIARANGTFRVVRRRRDQSSRNASR